MNFVVSWPTFVAGGGGGGAHARVADHDPDLYALWSSIFERARAADAARGESLAAAPASVARDANAQTSGASRADKQNGSSSSPGLEPPAASGAPAQTSAAGVPIDSRPRSAVAAGTGVPNSGIAGRASLQLQREVDRSAEVPPARRMAMDKAAAGAAATAEAVESVHVFVRAGVVSIVARAAMPEQDAVYCAFEAARQLTGERAALQRLTFNGRLLYQHPGERAAPPAGPLVFAC